jgi:hypothetical protein
MYTSLLSDISRSFGIGDNKQVGRCDPLGPFFVIMLGSCTLSLRHAYYEPFLQYDRRIVVLTKQMLNSVLVLENGVIMIEEVAGSSMHRLP